MNKAISQCILILFICSFNPSFSQQKGSISGYVKYNLFYPTRALNPKPAIVDFYFNNEESVSIDSKKTDVSKISEQEKDVIKFTLPYGDSLGAQIYRNFKKKQIITRRPKNSISDAFIVTENWVDIDWNILNKTKRIGNYDATMAKGNFRGRDYTVWFTYDIPLPFGPWKLHGLPGLILEGEDSEKMMRFSLLEIKINTDQSINILLPVAEKEIMHKEEVYMQDNFDALLAKKMNSKVRRGTKIVARPNTDGRKYKLEKTYEWETEK